MPHPDVLFAAGRRLVLWLIGSTLLLSGCDSRPTGPQLPGGPPVASQRPAGSTARTSAQPDSTRWLGPRHVGVLRVGMSIGELRRRYGPLLREVTIQRGEGPDAIDIPAYTLGQTRGADGRLPAVLLEPLCREGEDHPDGTVSDHCRIWRITVRDPAYHTTSGIGVGARFGDLKLGTPLSFVGPSPMGIAATSEEWQMNFLLDPAPIEASQLPLRRETIPDSVRVIGVQVF